MLARANRVKTPDEFRRVLRRGRRLGGALVVAHTLRTEDAAVRFGFIVGRAVGNAVVRNRVKRRLRAAAQGVLPSVADGTVVVVRALPSSATGSFAELDRELAHMLNVAAVLK